MSVCDGLNDKNRREARNSAAAASALTQIAAAQLQIFDVKFGFISYYTVP